eukprot:15463078-Alexandrium_andersonii.AAC.1
MVLPGGAPPPRTPREAPPAHPPALSVTRSGVGVNKGAECTPPELRGSVLRPFLGPCSSGSNA